jgi:hypothetical protein
MEEHNMNQKNSLIAFVMVLALLMSVSGVIAQDQRRGTRLVGLGNARRMHSGIESIWRALKMPPV